MVIFQQNTPDKSRENVKNTHDSGPLISFITMIITNNMWTIINPIYRTKHTMYITMI